MTCCFLLALSNRSFRMHGIQNPLGIAGQIPHGMDGMGANPQNIQSALGVDGTMDGTTDGTTGVLRLQRSQRITQSTLGGGARGAREEKVQLIGSSMVGMKTHGVIMMRGRVMDGGDGAVN